MRNITSLFALAIALAACNSDASDPTLTMPSMDKATTSMQNYTYDDTGVFPAQVNCTGEAVAWELHFHVVFRSTIDPNGGFHGSFVFQDRGSFGIGLTTGLKYVFVQSQTEHISYDADQLPMNDTGIFTRRFISQGSTENFQVHNVFHFTIDANGNMTSFKNTVSRVCN